MCPNHKIQHQPITHAHTYRSENEYELSESKSNPLPVLVHNNLYNLQVVITYMLHNLPLQEN